VAEGRGVSKCSYSFCYSYERLEPTPLRSISLSCPSPSLSTVPPPSPSSLYLLNILPPPPATQAECGSAFTTKLEGMFKDIDLSKDVMASFRASAHAAQVPPSVELAVHVLTQVREGKGGGKGRRGYREGGTHRSARPHAGARGVTMEAGGGGAGGHEDTVGRRRVELSVRVLTVRNQAIAASIYPQYQPRPQPHRRAKASHIQYFPSHPPPSPPPSPQGYWPTYSPVEVNLPREILELQTIFSSFYMSKHNGRRLLWHPYLGHCTLRANFPLGRWAPSAPPPTVQPQRLHARAHFTPQFGRAMPLHSPLSSRPPPAPSQERDGRLSAPDDCALVVQRWRRIQLPPLAPGHRHRGQGAQSHPTGAAQSMHADLSPPPAPLVPRPRS
jgi:hypothetical protein